MTYEEALNQFNSTNPFMHGSDKQEEYFNVIRKAIEKQIPKKPYLDNDNGIYEKMTEREALTEIKELIDNHWGVDPIYFIDSENREQAEAAKLCCCINEIINSVEDSKTF